MIPSDEPKPAEKKIIIDEDWKSQVETEKEAAQGSAESGQPADAKADEQAGPLPPPTLTFLASTLYLQGLVFLGMLPSPTSDQPEVNLTQAKHAIDTLDLLYQKTEGNRTADETKEMDTMLHEIRMAYVAVQQQPQQPPADEA